MQITKRSYIKEQGQGKFPVKLRDKKKSMPILFDR